MASDVFAENHKIALEIEDGRGVNSTGAREISLSVAQAIGQFEKLRLFDPDRDCRINRRKLLADEFDARFSTETATRGNGAETMGGGGTVFRRGGEHHIENVAERGRQSAPRDLAQIVPRPNDSFGKKKAGSEFLVVARRAHGDRERVLADPNFQGLLDCNFIGHAFMAAILFSADDAARTDALPFSVREVHVGNHRTNNRVAKTSTSGMTFSAVLLAGGESRRMGRDKAALVFQDEPLWRRQLRVLRDLGPQKVFVSARTKSRWLPDDTELLLDEPPSRGPLSGLAKALAQMQTTHLVVLAVDMPFVTREQLQFLCLEATEGCGIVPLIGERAEPLAAIYPKESAWDFAAALAGIDLSLQPLVRKLAAAGKVRLHPVPSEEENLYLSLNEPSDIKEGRFPKRPPQTAGGLETAPP